MANQHENPPESFRLLSAYPTVLDLKNVNPFIRPCLIQEPYDSIEHYLDVQFRVLREDFISPLRKGLTEYIDGGKNYKNNDLRVYKNVKLVASAEINKHNNVGIKVFFGPKKDVRWQDSRRFMYGSFVMLSSNDFNSIIFATISDRDEKQLQKGFVSIKPLQQVEMTRYMYDARFDMLESKIFFEPYHAVLTSMLLMGERNFPMEHYLVEASRLSNLPRYLENKNLFSEIDTPWQAAQKRKLDASQYNAFKHALSEEFAIIQGPPGTGKTFIALEIVRTLLENKKKWLKYGPIVVVCFTNHALDQFLEGILNYTKSIVRIGDRSKNEVLKPFTLREIRDKSIKNRHNNQHQRRNAAARKALFLAKKNSECVLSDLAKEHKNISYLSTPEAIVPFDLLKAYNRDDRTLTTLTSNEKLVTWLAGEGIYTNPKSNGFFNKRATPVPDAEIDDDYADDHLKLNYKIEVSDHYKLIYPIVDINSKVEIVNQKIKYLRACMANEVNSNKNNYAHEINNTNGIKAALIEKRNFLRREFENNPILNRNAAQTENARWRMYWNWVRQSYYASLTKMNNLKIKYQEHELALNRAKELVDVDILREREIVGLTTTRAARLHVTLNELHAPIVVVEEAAEILESHIVCSMTRDCQHVILIGDHKQLRPKPSDYRIGKEFNLEISLFERMVNIRGNCNQLNYQHRMRPEISRLIKPAIYDNLNDHKIVFDFPNVKGVEKNLFFLNHQNPEYRANEESWTNQHEAQFLIAFAKHLVKQGYTTENITVLCTYIGQLFELRKEKNKFPILKDLNITTVDNYQGEENRIILLSLVRNNNEGNIGFLKEENRVCVALSRAKEGLYVMGNMSDLIIKNKIWPKIKKVFEEQEAIGDSITLICQNHPEEVIKVKNQTDFLKSPEGGCLRICGANLNCGHICSSMCHILDKEHEEYRCKKPCVKLCPMDHPCTLKCWEGCKPCRVEVTCTLKCGHTVKKPCSVKPEDFQCKTMVKAVLPSCGHEVEKFCYLSVDNCPCSHPCEYRVPCGHSCTLKCHVKKDPDHLEYKCVKECPKECDNGHPCKKKCYQPCGNCPMTMKKVRSCGHVFLRTSCHLKVEELYCEKSCKRTLNCGHKCPMKCSEPCGNCPIKVEKLSTCGHKISLKCHEAATPSKCNGSCPQILACGHKCNRRCKDPCTVNCMFKVPLTYPGLCGHIFSVPCYLRNNDPKNPALLEYCDKICLTMLECEHRCGGTCGKCLQGRIHLTCQQPCSNILVCGHKCKIPCRKECQPCNEPCEIKCTHSKCNKKCGQPCAPCKEKCNISCEHKKCSKLCSQFCDIKPCDEPCNKLLKCNHPCVGFSCEPCPPLCRICDKDELTEILFGTEDEEDARFILLEDCGHCIESSGLIDWINKSSDGAVVKKVCPKCKTPITRSTRFINQVKEFYNNLLAAKEKIFSENNVNLKHKQENYVKDALELKKNDLVSTFTEMYSLISVMVEKGSLVNKNRSQTLSWTELEAFRLKLDILKQMLEILSSIKNVKDSYNFVTSQVSLIVGAIPSEWQLTKQNVSDIELELTRLQYLIEICNKTENQVDTRQSLMVKVLTVRKFTIDYQREVKEELRQKLVLSVQERQMIVKAMNLNQQGHWYKCPNGHIYVITECGGAVETSRCNECNATIGGSSHRLLESNSLASEMDGATRPAWPTGMLY